MSYLQSFNRRPSYLARIEDSPFYGIQSDINRIFGSLLSDAFVGKSQDKKTMWSPRIDLKETPKEYIVTADIPGCDKNDVHVSLHNDVLSITGERKCEENKNDQKCHFSERIYGAFERQISIPENTVDKNKINAKFENGVLQVTLAKANETQNEPRRIEIK